MTLTNNKPQNAPKCTMKPVPSPREVLTSIINTLSAFDPAQSAPVASQTATPHRHASSTTGTITGTAANPLKLIPNSHRALLTTLHVLYPSTLLPALDLLDRKLVTKVTIRTAAQPNPKNDTGGNQPQKAQHHDQTHSAHLHPSQTPAEPAISQTRNFYLVRSAQPQSTTHHRRRRDKQASGAAAAGPSTTTTSDIGPSSAGGKLYVVRLDAWNCSCAAFAFSAFPPEQYVAASQQQGQQQQDTALGGGGGGGGGDVNTSLLTRLRGETHGAGGATGGEKEGRKCGYNILPPSDRKNDDNEVEELQDRAGVIDHEAAWDFGGFSIDGLDGSGISSVPCCKHLLACLLGERWKHVLGAFIEDRLMSREEAAGLVSDT